MYNATIQYSKFGMAQVNNILRQSSYFINKQTTNTAHAAGKHDAELNCEFVINKGKQYLCSYHVNICRLLGYVSSSYTKFANILRRDPAILQ